MHPKNKGTLYLVATPIGNLKDITLRAIETLQSVDLVVCEDTRRSGLLLHHLGIRKPLESFHDHSPQSKSEKLVGLLLSGQNVAYVTDAGTPLVSDPGFPLMREAIGRGIRVESIPGPCALTSALILSGLPSQPFAFFGYVPEKEKKRKDFFKALLHEKKTLIFYESPHRLAKSLGNLTEIFGDRQVAVAREMTKKFEEIVRGKASEVYQYFSNSKALGECVIVVEGAG